MEFFDNIKKILFKKEIYFKGTDKVQSIKILTYQERKIISGAVAKRQQEFATVRWCLRQLFQQLGIEYNSVLKGKDGEPILPHQLCGSVSHTNNAYCAAVAFKEKYKSLGIDIEDINRDISESAIKFFMNKDELVLFKKNREIGYEKLVFSAKESVFKLLSPLIKESIHFSDVSIFPKDEGTFIYRINRDINDTLHKGLEKEGLYFKSKDFILTLCSLAG